jgi:hypothetical protein
MMLFTTFKATGSCDCQSRGAGLEHDAANLVTWCYKSYACTAASGLGVTHKRCAPLEAKGPTDGCRYFGT